MSMKRQGEREKLGIFTHSFVKDVFKNALKNFNPSGGYSLEMKRFGGVEEFFFCSEDLFG